MTVDPCERELLAQFLGGRTFRCRSSPNPNTVLRAGDLQEWRKANHDAPRNSHLYLLQVVPELVPLIRSAQTQIAECLESDGKVLAAPGELREYWQVPLSGPLPEELNSVR